MRSTPTEFQQRYIDMQMIVQADVGQLAYPTLVDMLRDDNDVHACVFVNFVSDCAKLARDLEKKIADEEINVGVLQISREMDKNEKNAFTRLFTSAVRMRNFRPRVLVATSAANTGIDQVLVKWVLTVGLPRCLTTLLQEHDHNRFAGIYLIMTDWKMFVRLLLSILLPNSNLSDGVEEHKYCNSMIMARTPEKRS
mmetsp:Transcript_13705/g.23331  ORF Transcript_13705/g.23331 Transcript_13705/m.23331 type:complete len:196 (+) Transcript_13705:212-799(+)